MTDKTNRKALVYCRVSDKKQESEGDGLNSQEHRCRAYAVARGHAVEAVFHDTKSGGGDFMSRPGMVSLLKYLDKNKKSDYVVVFDDLKRFARDREFHFKLRAALRARDAQPLCLNYNFDDSPEGEFIETIIAAQGQLERKQNGRQVQQKMKSRLERGYWAFQAPLGYRYVDAGKDKGGGKILVRDEPLASIMSEAFEGYASGRFQLQAEVQRFLESNPEFPKSKGNSRIARLLNHPIYAGYVEHEPWGVSLRKGRHDPLISFETHQRILERMNGNAKAPQRKNLNLDFPLRGFVACADCGGPLTSGWTKGRISYHPYYLCHKRECASYGKSIRKDVIEGRFDALLVELQPSPEIFGLSCVMFEELWNHEQATGQARARSLKAKLSELDRQIEQLVNRIVDASHPSVIKALEGRISTLEEQKALASERIANCGRPLHSFDESLRTALDFLASPCILWRSPHYDDKQAVLKLAFDERLAYDRNEGFRTANLALPFKALAELSAGKNGMVDGTGIEPVTPAV